MSEQLEISMSFSPGLRERIDSYFVSLGLGFNPAGLMAERRDILLYYNAKSDAELVSMGLTRAAIPAHVFGDLFGSQ